MNVQCQVIGVRIVVLVFPYKIMPFWLSYFFSTTKMLDLNNLKWVTLIVIIIDFTINSAICCLCVPKYRQNQCIRLVTFSPREKLKNQHVCGRDIMDDMIVCLTWAKVYWALVSSASTEATTEFIINLWKKCGHFSIRRDILSITILRKIVAALPVGGKVNSWA